MAAAGDGLTARNGDLIDQFTDLVIGGNEPRRLAEQTLGIVLTLTHGRCAAVFTIEGGRPVLFASHALDQSALDAAHADWAAHRAELSVGRMAYTPSPVRGEERPRATAPVHAGERLIGLLYVDSASPHFLDDDGRRRLLKFNAIMARALEAAARPSDEPSPAGERGVERKTAEGLERERLLMLLERNEWNIARVARILGVTRRTIYLRLARFGVAREHVRKPN